MKLHEWLAPLDADLNEDFAAGRPVNVVILAEVLRDEDTDLVLQVYCSDGMKSWHAVGMLNYGLHTELQHLVLDVDDDDG